MHLRKLPVRKIKMDKNETKDKKKVTPLNVIGADSSMVCGPDGCSLAGHFDRATDNKDKTKKSK